MNRFPRRHALAATCRTPSGGIDSSRKPNVSANESPLAKSGSLGRARSAPVADGGGAPPPLRRAIRGKDMAMSGPLKLHGL